MNNRSYKLAKYTRNALLLFAVSLFLIFYYLFTLSYNQEEKLEVRAYTLSDKLIESQDDIQRVYLEMSEVQQAFRFFSVKFDPINLKNYQYELTTFKSTLDTIISQREKYIATNDLGTIGIDHHKNVFSSYKALNNKLNDVIQFSKHFNSYLENRKQISVTNPKLNKLIETNFNLLYALDQTFIQLNNDRFEVRKKVTAEEKADLFKESKKFKVLTILSLFFMFILICVIIYYQNYTSLYMIKLNNQRIYANKLADKNANVLSEITHAIRTPINALIGILDLLKKKVNIYEQKDLVLIQSAYTSIIETSKTINEILDSQTYEIQDNKFKSFDIKELFIEIIELYKAQAEVKKLNLKYTIDENDPTIISSDKTKIKQIINNLISNAIKFSEKGTITCLLKILNNNTLQISIKDEGIGIPQEIRNNIFKKYFTAETNNNYSTGIGLGLYVVKNIVDSLNGYISVESILNKGSKFVVEIPIPTPEYKKIEVKKYNGISDLSNEIKWLLVDDNALNLFYLSQFFSNFPNIKTAKDGAEGLAIIEKEDIDIVITDINMPVMMGDELLVKIREQEKYNHIKVIATSSDNAQIKKLEVKNNCYFNGILIKPFNEKDLTEVIFHTLGIEEQ